MTSSLFVGYGAFSGGSFNTGSAYSEHFMFTDIKVFKAAISKFSEWNKYLISYASLQYFLNGSLNSMFPQMYPYWWHEFPQWLIVIQWCTDIIRMTYVYSLNRPLKSEAISSSFSLLQQNLNEDSDRGLVPISLNVRFQPKAPWQLAPFNGTTFKNRKILSSRKQNKCKHWSLGRTTFSQLARSYKNFVVSFDFLLIDASSTMSRY